MRHSVLGFAVAIAGCTDPAPVVPAAESHVLHFDIPQFTQPRLDLLFVVESSPAMAAHHDRLATSYRQFATVLETLPGGVPDLHLGVTTADLGGPGCGAGDGGEFHRGGTVTGDFLVDIIATPDGTRERNYSGDLATALTALLDVGSAGCPTAQPLAAMQRVLQRPGFRRADAYLLVVVVAATDDTSPQSLAESQAFLGTLAADPHSVVVSLIGGLATDTCIAPTTRLAAFADQFPDRSVITSICADDHTEALSLIAQLYVHTLLLPCLGARPADVDPTTTGAQHDCVVSDVIYDRDGPVEETRILPACDAGRMNRPCWWFRPELGCEASGLEVRVERLTNPFRGTHTVGQCVAE